MRTGIPLSAKGNAAERLIQPVNREVHYDNLTDKENAMKSHTPEKLVAISRYKGYFPTLPEEIQRDVYQRITVKMIQHTSRVVGFFSPIGGCFCPGL